MQFLADLDRQLYSAIVSATASSTILAVLVVVIAWLNWNGLVWWLAGLLISRARGFGRRGTFALLTVYLGMIDGWLVSELLKLVFRRPRPFTAIVPTPLTLIDHPASFSFPSGDATFAIGAAVALGSVVPRWRWPAYLLALAVCFERVAVGVHYPSDVLAGAVVGAISGRAARDRARPPPRALARLRRCAYALGSRVGGALRELSRAARTDGLPAARPARARSVLPLVHVRRTNDRHRRPSREAPAGSAADRSAGPCRAPFRRSVVRARGQPARLGRVTGPQLPGGLTGRGVVRARHARWLRGRPVRPSRPDAAAAARIRLRHVRILARRR